MSDFAARLEGLTLKNGWRVRSRLVRSADATGGHFSVGYVVESPQGNRAYLKAIDIAEAFGSENLVDTLAAIAGAHRHECALLETCRVESLDRVVWALDHGEVQVEAGNAFSRVPYIVFEFAEADVRAHPSFARRFDHAWAARTLHQVAIGLQQLHSRRIAHQDLKPSNVMVFDESLGAKVADLGCASQLGRPGHRDEISVPGDTHYAPPEQLYNHILPDWSERRLGSDLYQLGSLVTFLFGKVSMTELLLSKLDDGFRPGAWNGTYADVLPHLRASFALALSTLASEFPVDSRDDLLGMVRSLCDPDPSRRGHPADRAMRFGDPHSLARYVSELNVIASRAERGLRQSLVTRRPVVQ